ncbi:MAG: hypothetical protein WC069_05655 [Candidatus Shapirobacteria bacterium]
MVPNQLLAISKQFTITGPGVQPSSNVDAAYKFETLASQVIGVLTIIAILYFIVQIIFAGYAFISSQGDQKTMETTRKRLTEAVLGLVIVIIALGLGNLIAVLFGIDNILSINTMFILLRL